MSTNVSQHVPEQGRVGVEGREVGVHVRTLPVGHPWHDDTLDVREDLLELLALLKGEMLTSENLLLAPEVQPLAGAP